MTTTVTVVGTLGRDPELRYTAGATPLCNFSVASTRKYERNGVQEEETTWIDVTAWGSLAENAAASLSKGARVIVSGRLKTETWEDRETQAKRSKLSLQADAIGPDLRWATVIIEKVERT